MSEQSAARTTRRMEHGAWSTRIHKDTHRMQNAGGGMRTAMATSQHDVPLLLLLLRRPGCQDGQHGKEAGVLRLMDGCKGRE